MRINKKVTGLGIYTVDRYNSCKAVGDTRLLYEKFTIRIQLLLFMYLIHRHLKKEGKLV